RQLARDRRHLVAVEAELVADELHARRRGRVEEVLALEVRVELRDAGADRTGVDRDLRLAGLALAVDRDGAFLLVEAPTQRRGVEVPRLEGDEGVRRIDRVGDGVGLRGDGG